MLSPQQEVLVDRACGKKAIYKNRKEAARAASRLRSKLFRRYDFFHPVELYHCDFHHGYHVGHPPQWRQQPRNPNFKVKL